MIVNIEHVDGGVNTDLNLNVRFREMTTKMASEGPGQYVRFIIVIYAWVGARRRRQRPEELGDS
jgi:hypothetical protein